MLYNYLFRGNFGVIQGLSLFFMMIIYTVCSQINTFTRRLSITSRSREKSRYSAICQDQVAQQPRDEGEGKLFIIKVFCSLQHLVYAAPHPHPPTPQVMTRTTGVSYVWLCYIHEILTYKMSFGVLYYCCQLFSVFFHHVISLI